MMLSQVNLLLGQAFPAALHWPGTSCLVWEPRLPENPLTALQMFFGEAGGTSSLG